MYTNEKFDHLLRESVELSTSRTVGELEETKRLIQDAGDRMSRKERPDPRESEECKWCDHVPYCPLKTDAPMPVYDQLELAF